MAREGCQRMREIGYIYQDIYQILAKYNQINKYINNKRFLAAGKETYTYRGKGVKMSPGVGLQLETSVRTQDFSIDRERYTHTHTHTHTHTLTYQLWPLSRPGSSKPLVTTTTPSTQILASKCYFVLKRAGLHGEKADTGLGHGMYR
uniref:Uncharacterized protein n=1 Tax=Myotis myotis TaxID=51298 RepID=A0A7J7XZQ5_MYOMY|nr:hypothetical protein mMyoMyo1_011319 [Myotis myotis]